MFSPFKDNNKNDSNELYPLHKAVFHNDLRKMEALFKSGCDINKQDVHGNTPLHIATILGHKDAIHKLLEREAVTRLKNNGGWSSLLEAVSYGDRQTITSVLSASKTEAFEVLASRKPYLLKMLNSLGDFYLELKWDFQTWIPLLSKILPSDTCKIFKRGCAIRMDTTLVSFNERKSTGKHLVIMDNKNRSIREFGTKLISTKPITFVRAMAGWFFKHEKSEERREHLTAEDVKKNKAFIQEFATGTFRSNGSTNTVNTVATGVSDDVDDMKNRKSLCPPPKSTVSWQEYITSTAKPPPIGRPHVEKTNSKEFKAVVAMSQDFPLPVTVLLDILEIVSPFKHIGKLKDFCNARLPPGFPVKLEIPLLPTISAKVTFQKFEWRDDLTTKFFVSPDPMVKTQNDFLICK
uniref:Ankyrin repeat domain-containing protein 13C n=1 Tax=Ditylenchus dipsaci TaxID=166011 RepID=A0A915CYK9_9BILA